MTPNISPVDPWTLVHAGVGMAAGAIGVPIVWAIAGAAAYEVAEYAHESPSGSALFGTKRPESLINAATDVLVFWVGYAVAARYRR